MKTLQIFLEKRYKAVIYVVTSFFVTYFSKIYQALQGRTVDALALTGDEGRGRLR